MNRSALEALKNWKEMPNRKPLIIQGARQVGKTWLMKTFGSQHFSKVAYFNFETTTALHSLFEQVLAVKQIVAGLSILAGFSMEEENTLIIFDEIQACPKAITSLKYFYEEKPDFYLMAAGSLLGVAIHDGVSFPVGKVDFLMLRPLNFHEFLQAMGKQELLGLIESENHELLKVFDAELKGLLKQYFFIGGMPEVVKLFAETGDYKVVRRAQENIILAYENDFSKHAPSSQLPRIRMVWQSVTGQLAKENSKFIYSLLRQGARAKEFELALEWLKDSGLIHKVTRLSKAGFPLTAYADWADFKVYLHDVGLLCAMGKLSPEILLKGNDLFTEFKGSLAEQFVLQQLTSASRQAFYWNPENTHSEVDFVIQVHNEIIPIEVKASENVRSKSLAVFHEKYKPATCIRTSLLGYRKQDWLTNVPLYGLLAWAEK